MTKVSLLTIGNEVVDGQIINRNASTLSEALIAENFVMDQHLSTKDTLPEIQKALDYLSLTSDLILTTGGLGPTTDDCTRMALSQWLNKPLELCDTSWLAIQNRLQSRDVTVRPDHKNQAYGPKGCTMLANPVGVAPGFFCEGQKSAVAALPGPPRELHGIWTASLRDLIVQNFKPKSGLQLSTWICMGVAESEVQHGVKDLLESSGLDYGYRLSKPYVEVKVWWDLNQDKSLTQTLFPKITKALGTWLMGSSIAEIREPFVSRLQSFSKIQIIDGLSGGLFLKKFQELVPESTGLSYLMDTPENLTKEIGKTLFSWVPTEKSIGFFVKDATTAYVVDHDQTFEISTYRNIPVMSPLGALVVLERFFQRVG